MKKLLTLALAILGVASLSAATVDLDWDDNPAGEGISNYIVYEDNGGSFSAVTSSQISEVSILAVVPGVHTYVVTAINVWGEGPQSDSVTTPSAASAPQGLVIVVIVP